MNCERDNFIGNRTNQSAAAPWTWNSLDPQLPDLGGEHGAEPVSSKPDRLVADLDAALVQQVVDVPQRERERDIQHHGQADDLRARLEILEWAGFGHSGRLPGAPAQPQGRFP